MFRQPLVWALGAIFVAAILKVAKEQRNLFTATGPWLVYVLCSLAVAGATIWKTGASTNYFFESLLAMLAFVCYSIRNVTWNDLASSGFSAAIILVLASSALELLTSSRTDFSFATRESVQTESRVYQLMREKIDSLNIEDPAVLNLFTHRETYSVTNRDFVNDPYHYKLLLKDGILDADPMVSSIIRHDYDVVMIPVRLKNMSIEPNFQKILDTVTMYYHPATQDAGYKYYVPD